MRYGNVIGSRGSVIELFKRLIEEIILLPITDPRETRFGYPLKMVSNLYYPQFLMSGGEIFIPKIPSAKIIDVATAMAFKLEHKIIGIRVGEKLLRL